MFRRYGELEAGWLGGTVTRPLITSVGIEIEFAQVPKVVGRDIAAKIGWRIVEDGSCRSHRPAIGRLPVISDNNQFNSQMFGGELVSPILNTEDDSWKRDVALILERLANAGEGVDALTSIHIHINLAGLPMFAVRYLVEIALYLEAGLFRLSCAEAGVHRGAVHLDYGYCRPISKGGPPVMLCRDGLLRPVFSAETVKRAQNHEELKRALGRFDQHGGGKYHEARYTWLNLVALFQYGSVEFRSFNTTHNHKYILAWVELCKSMARCAFGKRTELPINPLGTTGIDFPDIIEFLMIDEEAYTLERLWNLGSFQRSIRGPQMGHLRQEVDWRHVSPHLVPLPIGEPIFDFRMFESEETRLVPGFSIIGDCCV